eukprot:1958433-Prymnesium_polylepis.1
MWGHVGSRGIIGGHAGSLWGHAGPSGVTWGRARLLGEEGARLLLRLVLGARVAKEPPPKGELPLRVTVRSGARARARARVRARV